MTAATKTKTKKIETIRPPREIVENTKARRAWLADKAAEINAQPGRQAKIVGTGSYQEVSVYAVTEVAGRVRHRGTCQYCGASQVVAGGVMVHHGYKRPGDGYTHGRCPGMELPPLQYRDTDTRAFLAAGQAEAERIGAEYETAKDALTLAENARRASTTEPVYEAYHARPRLASRFGYTTPEQTATYLAAKKEWAVRYPLTAAEESLKAQVAHLTQVGWAIKQLTRHLQGLLDLNLVGKPLEEVVVA